MRLLGILLGVLAAEVVFAGAGMVVKAAQAQAPASWPNRYQISCATYKLGQIRCMVIDTSTGRVVSQPVSN